MPASKNFVDHAVAEVDLDLSPFLKRYKDGRIERLLKSTPVAASENPANNRGVATRDVVIDHNTGVSARLFLPSHAAMATGSRRLPLIVYIHGGSFCTESAFCRTYHGYATSLAASAGALVVSVEYRLAPEHPIPAAYDDAWSVLKWVGSLADPWLTEYADPARTFLAGDSAGGNITYHTAVRASRDGGNMGVNIEGMVIVHPYFWGAKRLPSEEAWDGATVFPPNGVDWLWPFVTAGQAGNDDPRLNPPDEEIASLTCQRVLVAVAGKDTLRERGCRLLDRFRDYYACTGGEAMLVESEGEDHGFHLYSPLRATSRRLMASIVHFINQPPVPELDDSLHWHVSCEGKKIGRTTTSAARMALKPMILGVPRRPFMDVFGYGMDKKRHCSGSSSTTSMAYATSKTGGGRAKSASAKKNYGLFLGTVWPNKQAYKGPAAALPGARHVIKNMW